MLSPVKTPNHAMSEIFLGMLAVTRGCVVISRWAAADDLCMLNHCQSGTDLYCCSVANDNHATAGQLSLTICPRVGTVSDSQRAVMLCSWEVKAGMIGRTVILVKRMPYLSPVVDALTIIHYINALFTYLLCWNNALTLLLVVNNTFLTTVSDIDRNVKVK